MSGSRLPHDPLRKALRALAEHDAVEVMAEARQAARGRVTKLIEDTLVDELLHAAARLEDSVREDCRREESAREDSPRHTARTPTPRDGGPEPADPSEMPTSGEAWWAYGVLRAPDAVDVPGLEGIEPETEVQIVSEGKVAALVSAVPLDDYGDERLREHLEDLDWVERAATRHEAVLDEALRRVTIVPLRLCTLYHDREGLRRFLREHEPSLMESLATVAGCAEWGVKLFADPRAGEAADGGRPEQDVPEDHGGVSERPGATYLIQRQRDRERAARAAGLRASCVEAVHDRVARVAREATRNPPQRPEVHGREQAMLLNGAYLVSSEYVDELHETLKALQDEWEPLGFVIELTGPWPAYNFVSGAAGVMP